MLFETMVIEGHRPGPSLLITAGVHGDEWEPMFAVRSLVDCVAPASLAGRLILAPIVNRSAYQRGARVGLDGLDLARTCPGSATGSETEQVAYELSRLIAEADYFLDVHTGGVQLQIWPLAGYMLHSDPRVLDEQRRMARGANLPVVWGTDAAAEGRSLSVARDANVPAIYVEYLGGGMYHRPAVEALRLVCQNVMTSLEMIPGTPPDDAVRWLSEDPTPGSGHLQVQHPAPNDGLFVPAVELGEHLRCGELLGALTDDNGELHPIQAARDGMVIGLRVFPRVAAGDALGVVVNFKEL